MNIEERFHLVTRNLEEVISPHELKELLKTKKEVSVYWGTMPTGSPHISYFYPFLKIADFLKAGLKVKVLIADLHAALDGVPWKVLDKRQKYYEAVVPAMLKSLDVNVSKLEFIKGSKIQFKSEYFKDLLMLSTLVSVKDSIKAASEVVKLGDNPKLGGVLYPLMQALDEEHLQVDIQFGGTDQRKIFVFARENLPKLGYKPRVELMNFILPGLIGEKMSSSIEGSKIDIMDSEEKVIQKINKAECIEGNPHNGLMSFLKYVVFVLNHDSGKKFTIPRPAKFGGDVSYTNYEKLEKDFIEKKVHPLDLKNALATEINSFLEPIRKNKKLEKLYREAYH